MPNKTEDCLVDLDSQNVPHLLHIVPVGDDSVLDGVLQGEDTSLALGLVSDVGVLLPHTNHHSLVAGASNDGGEDSPGSVVSGEPGFAHAGAVVNNQRGYIVVTHFRLIWSSLETGKTRELKLHTGPKMLRNQQDEPRSATGVYAGPFRPSQNRIAPQNVDQKRKKCYLRAISLAIAWQQYDAGDNISDQSSFRMWSRERPATPTNTTPSSDTHPSFRVLESTLLPLSATKTGLHPLVNSKRRVCAFRSCKLLLESGSTYLLLGTKLFLGFLPCLFASVE